MRTITVKNIPDDLYKRIKRTANENRRSINSEIITRLENSLKSRRVDANALIKRIEKFQKGFEGPALSDELLQTVKEEGRL